MEIKVVEMKEEAEEDKIIAGYLRNEVTGDFHIIYLTFPK